MIKNITITFAAQQAIGMINTLIFSVLSGMFFSGTHFNSFNPVLFLFTGLVYIGSIVLYFLTGRLFLDRLEDNRKTFRSCFAISAALIVVSLIGLVKIASTSGNSSTTVSFSVNSIAGLLVNQLFGMSLNVYILVAFANAIISPLIQSLAMWVGVLGKKSKKVMADVYIGKQPITENFNEIR